MSTGEEYSIAGFDNLSMGDKYKAAIGCLKHISTLSDGMKQIPYAERIASKWLHERKIK